MAELNTDPYGWRSAAQRIGEQVLGPQLASVFTGLIQQESGFNPAVVTGQRDSPAGARGIAQLMPQYYPGVDPLNPQQALLAAAYTLKGNLKTFGGDVPKAVAAYNAGVGGVQNAVQQGGAQWRAFLPAETKSYLSALAPVLGEGRSVMGGHWGGPDTNGDGVGDTWIDDGSTSGRLRTTIQTINGRKVLVNLDTGGIIKDYGYDVPVGTDTTGTGAASRDPNAGNYVNVGGTYMQWNPATSRYDIPVGTAGTPSAGPQPTIQVAPNGDIYRIDAQGNATKTGNVPALAAQPNLTYQTDAQGNLYAINPQGGQPVLVADNFGVPQMSQADQNAFTAAQQQQQNAYNAQRRRHRTTSPQVRTPSSRPRRQRTRRTSSSSPARRARSTVRSARVSTLPSSPRRTVRVL